MASTDQVPPKVMRAALYTLYWAMVFSRNYCGKKDASVAPIYDLMDALHEIPQILSQWGKHGNNEEKLREYFGYFRFEKWRHPEAIFTAPDLVFIFDQKLREAD